MLQLRGHMIPTREGLPYRPDTFHELNFEQMCETKNDKPSPYLAEGRFTSVPLTKYARFYWKRLKRDL